MGRTSDARERLVAAALDLVMGVSWAETTVDAICRKADVRKGSFYYFFPSREDLMLEAVRSDWERVKPHLEAAFAPAVAPLDRLRRFSRLQAAGQEDGRRRLGCVVGCILNRIASALAPDEKRLRRAVREYSDRVLAFLERAVRDGQARREVRAGSPKDLARLLFEHLEGVLAAARILDDLKSLGTLEARLIGLVKAA